MMTLKSKLISFALGVVVTSSAFSQSARTVMVQSNTGVLLFPTNLWNANASAARSGLGLGTLAQSNAISISNVTGLQASLDSKLATNPTLAISNVSGLQGVLDGKLGTNPTLAISNTTGLQAALDSKLATNGTLQISNIANLQTTLDNIISGGASLGISNIIGLQSALDGKLGTNPTLAISNTTGLQAALDSKFGTNSALAISNVTGLQTALDGKLGTNPTLAISNVTGLQTALNGKLESTNTAANISANTYQFQTSTNTAPSVFQQLGFRSQSVTFGGFYTAYDGTYKFGFAHGSATNNLEDRVVFRPNSFELAVPLSFIGTNSAVAISSSRSALGLSTTNAVTFDRLITGNTGASTNYALQLGATNIGMFATTGPDILYFQNRGGSFTLTTNGTVSAPTFSATTFQVGAGGSITFSGGALVAATRTNLGLGATWLTNADEASFRSAIGLPLAALTNTNATGFRDALNIGTSNAVSFGSVLAQSNASFGVSTGGGVALGWQGTSDRVTIDSSGLRLNASSLALSFGTNNTTGAAITRTNLGIPLAALTNTNVTNFRTAIGLGETNNVAFNDLQLGGVASTNAALFLLDEETILGDGVLYFEAGEIIFKTPLQFNNTTNAAITRTNLGIPWTGLTNTNAATFQGALFAATNAAPTNTTNVAAWINLQVGTNTYKLPLYQ